jgi:hypothetical protein
VVHVSKQGQTILLPGDGERGSASSDPTVVVQEVIRDIQDTTLADGHLPRTQLRAKVAEGKEDWGDGFHVDPVPVLVQRGRDGSIIRTTPLNEIPGVHLSGGKLVPDEPTAPKEVDAKPTPVPLSTADREKLVGILATRLWRYYKDRGPNDPRYNPFRDGIPELPAGSPEHLQPLPGTPLYPATDGQIRDYLRRFVAQRATVINTNRFGGNTIQDLALRIE